MKNRKKQYLRSLRLAKKLAAVAMLSATLAGASTSLVKLTSSTAYAAEYKSGQVGSNKLEFEGKVTSNTKVTTKPMDLVAIIDYSSSYQSKRNKSLAQLKKLIEQDLSDDSQVMLQAYIYNKPSSYAAHGAQLDYSKLKDADWETGISTVLVKKSEAIAMIDKLMQIKYPNTPGGLPTYSDLFNAVSTTFGDKAFKNGDKDGDKVTVVPFEDVYSAQKNKSKLVSVIQFTDGWADTEKMDSTFADWAKKNAKTFMSVVNLNKVSNEDNNDPNSIKSMQDLGHPNIYNVTGKDDATVEKELIEQFKNTATESNTTTTKQKGQVEITPEEGITLKTAELVDPSGKKTPLTIKDNKVVYDAGELSNGKYTVNYTFEGNVKAAKKITASAKVDGKEVAKAEDTVTPNEPAKKVEPTVTRKTEKIPFNTIIRENKDLEAGVKKVVHKGVEGEKEFVTTTTPDVEGKTGVAKGNVSFTTKASVTTSNEIKPRSIFAIFDNSGSVHGGDDDRIRSSFIPLLETMSPNDQIQIATYGINQKTSYYSNGPKDKERMVTKMMNRAEFAKLAEDAMKGGTTREAIESNKLVYDFKGVKDSGSGYEFEDIFDTARNKDYTPVVMQFTDSWEYEEEIDSSFAEWSKSHAKTFMSVIYGSGRAEVAMKKAGHPNIFLAAGEFTKDSDQTKKVLEQIKATTTEVVKKGANQTVKVSIGGQGVTVTKAALKGAVNKDLPIKDGKVEFSEALADGSYTLEYEAKGSGTLKSLVTVDGKEAANKTDDLKGEAGQKGSSKTAENIIKQPEDEIIEVGTKPKVEKEKIPYQTTEEEDPTLAEGERKVKVKGVEGLKTTTTSYTLDIKTGEVTPSVKTDEEPKTDEVILVGTKGSKSETSEKKIPFETIIEKDPELDEGVEKVVREGVEGVIKVTTTYETQKGVKVEGSEKSTEEVVTEKVDKIVHVGTKKKAAQVKLRFLDQKSNKSLKDDEIVTNDKSKFGDEFSLKPEKELKVGKDLYRLVEIKLTDAKEDSKIEGLSEDKKSLTSKVTEAEQSYDAVYERVVYTSYVDENGKELDKTVEGAQEKKEIKGYDFVKTEKSDNGDVKHIYRAKPIKGKTPVKYAETNEKSGVMYSILGLIGAAALAESIRRKKQSK